MVPLDYKDVFYYKRGFRQIVGPIIEGNYRLTFTAATRKTGNLSGFSFQVCVIVGFYESMSQIILNTTASFTSFGVKNFEYNLTITNPSMKYLDISFDGGEADDYPYRSPSAAGITNVKF